MLLFSGSVSAEPFEGLTEAVRSGDYGSLKAVLVARDGEVLYEHYFHGTQADDLHMMHSVTKSVGSALIGIAHRKGKIRLDQGLGEIFSEHYPMSLFPYNDKAGITVEQVLQQRHGVLWEELEVDYRDASNLTYQAIISQDWYAYFLRRPTA